MKIRSKLHIITLTSLIAIVMIVAVLLTAFVITGEEKKNREHIDNAAKTILEIQQLLEYIEKDWDSKQIDAFLEKLDSYLLEVNKYKESQKYNKRFYELQLTIKEIANEVNDVRQLDFSKSPSKKEIDKRILKIFDLTSKIYNISRDKTSDIDTITIILVIFIGISSVFMITIHSIVITRDIVNPLLKLQSGANAIGDGNLHFRIYSNSKDEIGHVSRAFDEMAKHLESTVNALKEAETRYRMLVESINDWIYETDENGRYKYVSPNVKEMLGYESQEVIGKTIFDFMSVDDSTFQIKGFKSFINKGTSFNNWVFTLISKQGDLVYIESNGTPIFDEKGNCIGFRGANRNISKRKAIENERDKLINELQKALDKVKTLSGFLPICSACKKIRDDKGYWQQIESYIAEHSEAEFSHSICPECAKKLYPEYYKPKK